MNPIVSESFARTLPLDAPQWEVGDQVKLSAAWLIEQAGLSKGYALPGSKAGSLTSLVIRLLSLRWAR